MKYFKTIELKNGRTCAIRHATADDAQETIEVYVKTHEETDYHLTYPDEVDLNVETRAQYLDQRTLSPNELELVAELDGKIVGLAGLEAVGRRSKTSRRAVFGISILEEYWGLGIGRAILRVCVENARFAGYDQLELDVVADNVRAIALYQSEGFSEYGRNPRGFWSRYSGRQELVLMRLEL